MSKPLSCLGLLSCLFMAASFGTLHAQELIADGDFEGQDLPWVVSAVPSSNVTLSQQNSPFDNPYPIGTTSLELADDDSEDEFPSLRQSLAAGSPAIFFGFDFKAPLTANRSAWYVAWEGENGVTAFFFNIGGGDGSSLELNNQQKIGTLAPNKWYHVQGYAEASRQIVEGFLLGENGQRNDFQGRFSATATNQFSSVFISDG